MKGKKIRTFNFYSVDLLVFSGDGVRGLLVNRGPYRGLFFFLWIHACWVRSVRRAHVRVGSGYYNDGVWARVRFAMQIVEMRSLLLTISLRSVAGLRRSTLPVTFYIPRYSCGSEGSRPGRIVLLILQRWGLGAGGIRREKLSKWPKKHPNNLFLFYNNYYYTS